jgi:hypothetical protein
MKYIKTFEENAESETIKCCGKNCNIADEFSVNENPEDFGFIKYRNKWYHNKYCLPLKGQEELKKSGKWE